MGETGLKSLKVDHINKTWSSGTKCGRNSNLALLSKRTVFS